MNNLEKTAYLKGYMEKEAEETTWQKIQKKLGEYVKKAYDATEGVDPEKLWGAAGGVLGAGTGLTGTWLGHKLLSDEDASWGDLAAGTALGAGAGIGGGLLGLEGARRFAANRIGRAPIGYSGNRASNLLKEDMSLGGIWKDLTSKPTKESILARLSDKEIKAASDADIKKGGKGYTREQIAARAELLARGLGVYDDNKGSYFQESKTNPGTLELKPEHAKLSGYEHKGKDQPPARFSTPSSFPGKSLPALARQLMDKPVDQWVPVNLPYTNLFGFTQLYAKRDKDNQIVTKWSDEWDIKPNWSGDKKVKNPEAFEMYHGQNRVDKTPAAGYDKIEKPGLNTALLMRLLAHRGLFKKPAVVTGGTTFPSAYINNELAFRDEDMYGPGGGMETHYGY